MNENIAKEIEELKKIINKIENKCTWSYIGIGIGVVFLINYISLKQRKKRIEELSIDLKKMEEL